MSITADEVNFLVFRYLQESGFHHSAYSFGYESMIHKSNINGGDVPPGALISFIQKGLQYLELEANLNDDGTVTDGSIALLPARELLANDVPALKEIVSRRRELDPGGEKAMQTTASYQPPSAAALAGGPAKGLSSPSEGVAILEGHSSEVFVCAWNPTANILASGSGDATARIWTLPADLSDEGSVRSDLLRHSSDVPPGGSGDNSKDVTTLDWNTEGTLLATGSYDGQARVWSKEGALLQTLSKHRGPIFSLKWNRKGDSLLSGSVDQSAIVWDAKTGAVRQQFEFHSAPTLDVDWRNNTSFATCSTDKMIYVCRVGDSKAVKAFAGHTDEVNAIKWDPNGNLLASCSDDRTAKIWSLRSDECVCDFREHEKEIYTLKWSPTGPGSANPNRDLVLATASFDATIKLWDVEHATAARTDDSPSPPSGSLRTLRGHTDPVYSLAFSPDGAYLASGSFDGCVHVWDVGSGELVKTYKGTGGIFEVSWNKDGNRLAACFANSTIAIIDFRM